MTPIDEATKTLLDKLAAYLGERPGKDKQELGRRLKEVVARGQATEGQFTVGDLNIIQQSINTAEFMAQVLAEVAQQPPSAATRGADIETAQSQAQAKRLKAYQVAVARLMEGGG